jgi:5-methylcytosine-specific restriction enzyme subunit McrC
MSVLQGSNQSGLTADHVITEYGETDPIDPGEFPAAARQTIKNEINEGDEDRLRIEWLPDGRVQLHATSYVGLVSLPGGLTIEIRPKVKETDLLAVLQYSQGITAETIEQQTGFTPGNEFIHALATLFESELGDVIQRGLVREYRRHSDTEDHVRGRIAVQRQLQRHGPQPTQFECSYDTLTQDTVLNQAILYAADLLLRLIGQQDVGQALQRHKQVLQRSVELRPVRPVELEGIDLSRLASHYDDLFRLTKFVLRGVYTKDLHAGSRSSFSLLVDMNAIFESVVERGLTAVFADTPVTVRTQVTKRDLLWNGARPIRIRPDVLGKADGEPVFVGDAKWKQDTDKSREPSNSDLYQLLAYQIAHDTPGILFYPAQNERVASTYQSQLGHDLHLIEVPTEPDDSQSYPETVETMIADALPEFLI